MDATSTVLLCISGCTIKLESVAAEKEPAKEGTVIFRSCRAVCTVEWHLG